MRENASPNVDARPGARPDTGLDPWGVQAVGRRIACVWLPRFGLTVASRLDRLRATAPPLAGATPLDGAATNDAPAREGGTRDAGGLTGVALYRPGTRWQELLECSPDLEAAGIRPGLPLKDAQARVPGATYLPGDDVTLRAIAAAFVPVLDALDAFSPLVEPAPDGDLGAGQAVAYVDVAGLELLYGPELRLGEGLAKAAGAVSGGVAGVAGVGIASSKFVAWVAATRAGVTPSAAEVSRPKSPASRLTPPPPAVGPSPRAAARTGTRSPASRLTPPPPAPPGRTNGLPAEHPQAERPAGGGRVIVVPAGEEATFLEPLPLETLPLDLPARRALERLGVRALGAFARLPANAVAHRYGAPGRHAQRLAQGIDDAALHPRRPRPAARVELTFDWEETELDRLTFALKTLADQLATRLAVLGDEALGEATEEDATEEREDAVAVEEGSATEEDATEENRGNAADAWLEDDNGDDGAWPEDDVADPWPDDEPEDEPPLRKERPPEHRALHPLQGSLGRSAEKAGAIREVAGRGGMPGRPGKAARTTPEKRSGGRSGHLPAGSGGRRRKYAATALRVVWRLSDGETRELLLQLAEPGCNAALFTEHLRWHAEGLDRFLAQRPPPSVGHTSEGTLGGGETMATMASSGGPNGASSGNPSGGHGGVLLTETLGAPPAELRYEPMEQRQGVVGIALEAVGLQVPPGTQLKLLASPLQWGGGGALATVAQLDPVTRAQHARRTVARLQARWGPTAVQQPALTPSRLPERRVRAVAASFGLQIPNLTSDVSSLSEVSGLAPHAARRTPPADSSWAMAATRSETSRRRPASGAATGEGAPDVGEDVDAPLLEQAPLWLVDPPQEVRVLQTKRKGERPRLSGWPWPAGVPRERRIVRWGGPWKVTDPAFLATGEPARRDYYHIETEDGGAYLIYRDRVTETWYLQGVFD